MIQPDDVCLSCKAGLHDECSQGWALTLNEDEVCCCRGLYTVRGHWERIAAEERGDDDEFGTGPKPLVKPERKRGNSGYIDQAAWPGNADIGTLTDPESTGRKRVKKMYPITVGTVCEWAGLEHAGGGVHPIHGCINNPATDWHHGPDKNTLDNEKCSRGCGGSENVHIVCSFCHNRWHALNDPTYPPYDRIAQQAQPWLPEGEWAVHDGETQASISDLMKEEQARREEDEKNGRVQRRGRGGRSDSPAVDYVDDDNDDADRE